MSNLNGRVIIYELKWGRWGILCVDFPGMGSTVVGPLWGFPDVL